MEKELRKGIFAPYKLHIDTEDEHLLLCKIIDMAIDTCNERGFSTDDFEHVKRVIVGD